MNSESSFKFQIQLLETLDTYDFTNFNPENGMISKFISIYNSYDLSDDEKSECINNTFITFMTREHSIQHFWSEIEIHCFNNQIANSNENDKIKNDIYNFINKLSIHINNVFSAEEKSNLLQQLINGIPKTLDKVCKFTNYLWSFTGFRKMIQYIDLNSYKTGVQIQQNGIFSPFFALSIDNLKYSEMCESLYHLINDTETHEYVVKYIHRIFKLNEAYTMNSYYGGLLEINCSSNKFLVFIIDFIFAIYKKHNKEQNIHDDIIMQNKIYKINNYDINAVPLNVKIFVSLMYGMFVVLECCYKKYITGNSEYKNMVYKFMKKKYIQDIFIAYYKVHKYLNIEYVFSDLLKFFEFGIKKIVGIEFNNKIYMIISNIIGSTNETISNPYIRMSAFNTIKNVWRKVGFDKFTNIFNNLLKYINDVNIKKLDQPIISQIHHQYSITLLLLQMININHTINEESKYTFAETLYKLINNSYDLLQLFSDELYTEIISGPNAPQKIINYSKYYKIVLNTLMYTILIYKSMYDNKMVEIVFPETENIYIMLIGRILENLKMKNPNNIFQLKLHHKLDCELIDKCLDIIYNKIDTQVDIIYEIKNNIELVLKKYKTDDQKYLLLLDKLNQYEKTNRSLEYPDDLVDQITYQPIKIPFMIPNCDLILDRTSIMKQIYEREENPYTKEKLTLKMIEEYNKEAHVVEKIKQFNEKREKWMNENVLI
jgi:hypothetical protein